MRALAEFITKGRTQVLIVAVITAILPLLYWVSAAAVGLITLRRGLTDGLGVLLWVLLPAGAWAVVGDPTPLSVIAGTFILAAVLRQSVSWTQTLVAAMVVGLFTSLLLDAMLGELLNQIIDMVQEMFRQSVEGQTQLNSEGLRQLLLGGFGAVHTAMMLSSLVLARWWQALIYNPGGFRGEFHALRIPPLMSGIILLIIVAGPHLGLESARWLPMLLLPWIMAGVALLHGSVAKRDLGRSWLVMFYISTFVFGPYVITLLVFAAFIDSFVDIRRRIPARN